MNNTVVKIEMSGNRYNAYDIDGNKYTSEIGTSTRKGAYKLEWLWKNVKVKVEELIGGKFQWNFLMNPQWICPQICLLKSRQITKKY